VFEQDNRLDSFVKAYQGGNLYDFDNEILLTRCANRTVTLAGAAGSLLELGLGHGFTTSIYSKHFSRHVVLEGSHAVIRNFNSRFSLCNTEIIETLFEDYQAKEVFDYIALGFVLEHVDDPVKLLSHCRQFLKPGGAAFVSVPNAEVLNRRIGHVAGLLPSMTALSDNDRLLGHQRYYTVETLRADIEKAGFEVKHLEGLYLKPFATSQMVSLNLNKQLIDALCEIGIAYPELCCGLLAKVQPLT
jgi:SAM-dependent methyltransferase